MNTKFFQDLFKLKGDKIIWVVFFILATVSIALVYSASSMIAVNQYGGSNIRLLLKQLIVVAGGFLILQLSSSVSYAKTQKFFFIGFFILIPLMLIAMFMGRNVNNAARWIQIPLIGISLQVADIARLILIGILALGISKLPKAKKSGISEKKYVILYLLLPITAIVGLIVRGNMSTAILLLFISFFLMWLGNIKIKYMIVYGSMLVVLFLSVLFIFPKSFSRAETWKSRLFAFVEEKKGDSKAESNDNAQYQLEKAKIAIASSTFGKLPGKSRQRALLYSAHTDFIFAILIEEYGLIAGILMVLLYLVLLYRGQDISRKSATVYGSLLAYGLIFGIIMQAFIHMAVNTALIPVTGQPLPLVSMGGSSFWFTCLALGILQNIAHQNHLTQEAQLDNQPSQNEELEL